MFCLAISLLGVMLILCVLCIRKGLVAPNFLKSPYFLWIFVVIGVNSPYK